ncbi:gamma-glutamyl-gamma-aminobutyrate hydrolase family protein [soil metagenome]
MPPRPVIGVPTQTLQAIDGIPEGLPHSWVMNHRYFVALSSVGALPWMTPLLEDVETLRAMYEHLDGVFIAGGVDLCPSSYGAEAHELCGRTDPARDRVELQFTRWAMQEGKPVFGICRGMQVINVAAGGSLHQDCAEFLPNSIKHDYFPTAGFARDHLAHEVDVVPGTRLHGIYGVEEIRVNSMHHQGICQLAEDLVPSAVASDGLVEALETSDERFVVGVQWHPEMLIEHDAATRRLFVAFIEAAWEWNQSRALAALS